MGTRKNVTLEMLKDFLMELRMAQGFLNDVDGTLTKCTMNPDANLTQELGVYCRQMPEFKILGKQAEKVRDGLRQVCSGEVSVEDAHQWVIQRSEEINETLEHIFNLDGDADDCSNKGGCCEGGEEVCKCQNTESREEDAEPEAIPEPEEDFYLLIQGSGSLLKFFKNLFNS